MEATALGAPHRREEKEHPVSPPPQSIEEVENPRSTARGRDVGTLLLACRGRGAARHLELWYRQLQTSIFANL